VPDGKPLQQAAAPEGCHFMAAGMGPSEGVELPQAMVQALKDLLEHPATIFIAG